MGADQLYSHGHGMRVALPVEELWRALEDLASTNIKKFGIFDKNENFACLYQMHLQRDRLPLILPLLRENF